MTIGTRSAGVGRHDLFSRDPGPTVRISPGISDVIGGAVTSGIVPPSRTPYTANVAQPTDREVDVSHLIAISFDGPDLAGQALQALRQIERRGLLHLTDTAVLQKDAEGHVHTKNEVDSGVELGIGVVGTLGLLIGIAFPIAGVTAGLLGGAWAGSKMHLGVDNDFMERLRDELRPETSALLLMVDRVKPDAIPEVREAMQPLHGTVYETTLSAEAERTLHEVVEGWQEQPTT